MSTISTPNGTEIEHLVRRLRSDVRNRSLRPGDRYLSTRQVSRLFGVNLGLANQAIQKLVEEELLVRRDRSGTYVGSVMADVRPPRIQTVYVLVPESRSGASMVPTGIMVDVLHAAIAGINVQFSFLPQERETAYIQELIGTAQANGQLAGVAAISCSRDAYKQLSDMHVPMVILGSPDPDQQHLPSVDEDNFTSGLLLADYLIKHGHKRLGLLTGGRGRPGDHHFFDGIAEAMTRAGLAPNSLVTRMCPDLELLRVQTQALLEGVNPPTSIMCRSERMFDVVLKAATDVGLKVPGDLEIVFHAYATSNNARSSYPHVQTTMPFEEIVTEIARMLQAVRKGQPLEKRHVVIPVELRVPQPAATRG
jgi:DNA-binding LacI/PurR family transcriptional regulator